jgi:hypothetical protein
MSETSAKTSGSPTSTQCSACGHQVGEDAGFCGECGHPRIAEDPPTEPVSMLGNGAGGVENPTPESPPPSPWANGAAAGDTPPPVEPPPPWANGHDQPTDPSAAGTTAPPPPWPTQPQPQPGWTAQTPGMWPPQTGYGSPPHHPPPGYPATVAGGYPPPAERRTSAGLIVALVAACLVAVGLIVAVALLASSSGSSSPTITTITTSAQVKPISPSPGTAQQTSGSGAKSSSGTGVSVPQQPPATKSAPPSATTTPPSANVADASGARGVVQEHWARIGSGDYTDAYALLEPGIGGTDESSWVASHQKEHPRVLSAVFGDPTFNSPTDGSVPIVSLKTSATDGCKTWTGSYGVTKQNGQWIITSANLSEGPSC